MWRALVQELEVVNDGPAGAADLVALEKLVRARDRIAEVRQQLSRDGVTVAGSRGQVRPHPLLPVERQLAAEITQSIARLDLTPLRMRNARQLGRLRSLTR